MTFNEVITNTSLLFSTAASKCRRSHYSCYSSTAPPTSTRHPVLPAVTYFNTSMFLYQLPNQIRTTLTPNARKRSVFIISYRLTRTDEVRPLGVSFETSPHSHINNETPGISGLRKGHSGLNWTSCRELRDDLGSPGVILNKVSSV